mgnify:CR=1 FL=1
MNKIILGIIEKRLTKIGIGRLELTMKNKKVRKNGIGVIGALTIIFLVLKITNNITWPWIWVLSPIWITAILIIVIFATILICGRIKKGKW